MATGSRPSSHKRAREKAQAERNEEKKNRRVETRQRKANTAPRAIGEDPDLAGIHPGPQPRDPALLDLPADMSHDEKNTTKEVA